MQNFKSFTPLQYLLMDIAKNYKNIYDKLPFDKRLQFSTDLLEKHSIQSLKGMQEEADNPSLFYASICAYEDYMNKKSSGYPVSWDATSSGLQILSILSQCRTSMHKCNVIDTGIRQDAYKNTYLAFKAYIKQADLDSKYLDTIDQKKMKKAIMTAFYGSVATPEKLFGKGIELKIFFLTLNNMFPGAWKLNLCLQNLQKPTITNYLWTLPDNFNVNIEVKDKQNNIFEFFGKTLSYTSYENIGKEVDKSLSPNIVHSIDSFITRELVTRAYISKKLFKKSNQKLVDTLYNLYLNTGILSARILLYKESRTTLKGTELKDLLNKIPKNSFDIMPIHDCYRVLPNNVNTLRLMYNQLLFEISNSTLLKSIVYSIDSNISIDVSKNITNSDIKYANYALS